MGWTGLILTTLGTIAAIVSSYYAYVGDRRIRNDRARTGERSKYRDHLEQRISYWVRINLFIAFVALCALAVGIFLITQPSSSSPRPQPSGESTPPSSSGSTEPSQATGGTPSVSPNGGWSKQWGPGQLLFADNSIIDLDQVPPNVNAAGPASFQLTNNQLVDYDDIVTWTGDGTGAATAGACYNLVTTNGMQNVKPVAGDTYCAKTGQGNMAIFVVKQIQVDGTGHMNSALVQATVWTPSS
jgi:hypothetical protein